MTDTRTDRQVLRQGQHLALSEGDDARAVRFVVVDVDGPSVTVRTVDRLRTPFAVGAELSVRYSVIDDASYEGRVTLLDHVDQGGCPEYRFVLPTEMTRLQARNFRRLALLADEVSATLTELDSSGAQHDARLVDISAGGAGVLTGAELVVGGTYHLSCDLEEGSLRIECDATVVRASEDSAQYGLRFVSLRPAMEDKIVAFVLRQGLQRS
jgi:c-di-GMP-binding flagellar brake protein YcgR